MHLHGPARHLVVLLARSPSLASVPPSSRRIRCHSNIPSHISRAAAKKERWQQQALKEALPMRRQHQLPSCRPLHNRTEANRSTWIARSCFSCPVRTVSTSHNHKTLQDFQHKTLQAMQPKGKSASNHSSTRARVHPTTAAHTLSDYSSRRMHQQTVLSTPLHHCISTQTLTHETLLHRTSTEPALLRGQPCGQHSAPHPQTRSARDDTHDWPTPTEHHCTGISLLDAEQKMPQQQL